MACINERLLIQRDMTPIHHMVTLEYMDDYIGDIEHRVLSHRLPPEDMRIVERYKEFRKQRRVFEKVDFKKLMRQLTK